MKKLLLSLVLLFSLPAQAEQQHGLSVRGEGEIEVSVSNVILNLVITSQEAELSAAKSANEDKYNSVLKTILKKFNLEKSSIQSNHVSISPHYIVCEKNSAECVPHTADYYVATRYLTVKLDDLSKYDAIISALADSKIEVSTGEYGIDNKLEEKLKNQASEMAVDNAHDKAERYAKRLGVKIGKPIYFQAYNDGSNYRASFSANAAALSSVRTDTATLGKIVITVSVEVAYQIE